MAALGTDIAGVDDIDPYLTLAPVALAAGQSVMASLLHEPGALWWAPDRGFDIRGLLHRPFSAEESRVAIETECLRDERVESAAVVVERFGDELSVKIDLILTTDESKVSLTLAVNAVGEILRAEIRG